MRDARIWVLAFLVGCLAACQSAPVAELVARPGASLFRDGFPDASGNWPQGSGPTGSMQIVDGTYRIQVLSSNYAILAVPGHSFREVRIEADASRLAGPAQNIFGLACRSVDAHNYYFFVISSDGYFGLGKVKNGQTGLLGQEMMTFSAAIVQGEGSNHLRMDCSGKTLKGYVNGQVVAISSDTDFPSGQAGLVAGTLDLPGVNVAFDNFIVYKP